MIDIFISCKRKYFENKKQLRRQDRFLSEEQFHYALPEKEIMCIFSKIFVMLREIVVPENNTYLLKLPDEMVGKKVEVIAFEIDGNNTASSKTETPQSTYQHAIAFFKKHAIDFNKIEKWNREDLYE